MRIIFFQPNNRFLRHDGDEFRARACDCWDFWESNSGTLSRMFPIPKGTDSQKRHYVRTILDSCPAYSVDRIAVFCHGTSSWCDLGITTNTISTIAPNLDRVLTDDARIGLYCCLTGSKPNGLAAMLSDALAVHVLAHTTSGHTTRNPNKRMFFGEDKYTDMMPTDKAERKAWIAKLQTDKNAPFEALEAKS